LRGLGRRLLRRDAQSRAQARNQECAAKPAFPTITSSA
jgi:hypothetical protein